MPSKTLHDIAVEFVRETAKAVCYNNGEKDFWVPKSLMTDDGMIQVETERNGSITLTAPEWWLAERELI